jgi:hypothetical protein
LGGKEPDPGYPQEKGLNMIESEPIYMPRNTPGRAPSGRHAASAPESFLLRVGGHSLSLAADMASLEECLALERSANPQYAASEGIQSPPAVPYCLFLMLRSRTGALEAVCRLMRIDRENPIGNPLQSGCFHLSPLLTALRYSREGILEMGAPTLAPGVEAVYAIPLLWSGLIRYLERKEGNRAGFVLGKDALPMRPERQIGGSQVMNAFGLHPELETETRYAFRPDGGTAEVGTVEEEMRGWPPGLREALRRGCRLACRPVLNPATGNGELIWVASREMLIEGGPEDWRGG